MTKWTVCAYVCAYVGDFPIEGQPNWGVAYTDIEAAKKAARDLYAWTQTGEYANENPYVTVEFEEGMVVAFLINSGKEFENEDAQMTAHKLLLWDRDE